MPLILLGLVSAYAGSKIDDWFEGVFGGGEKETGQWSPVKVAFVASAALFVVLGTKKVLE